MLIKCQHINGISTSIKKTFFKALNLYLKKVQINFQKLGKNV
jgi:hypothetical protein